MKKIVIIGPESTGKSTLARKLAAHYNTVWCPEYARAYLLENGKDYDYADLLKIAQGQLAIEEALMPDARNGLYFIDTDMYVIKVWSEYVFNMCHPFILKSIAEGTYDLYLLCNIDLPWVKDELREYPDEKPRRELLEIYKDLLIQQKVPWRLISGTEDERTESAIYAIEEVIYKKNTRQ